MGFKQIAALIVPADDLLPIRVQTINDNLATLRFLVDGDIEGIYGRDWHGYCDEEGKLKGLPTNQRATHLAHAAGWPNRDVLAGQVVLLGEDVDDPGGEGSVPQRVVELARSLGYTLEEES